MTVQEGHKPAIDIGTSVSRVGGKTQAPALREVSGTMRLDYAQFLELEMFSRFGGAPDARVKTIGEGRTVTDAAVPTTVRTVAAGGRSGTGARAA
jgi:F0F1-type ATP synthase alpha subunit